MGQGLTFEAEILSNCDLSSSFSTKVNTVTIKPIKKNHFPSFLRNVPINLKQKLYGRSGSNYAIIVMFMAMFSDLQKFIKSKVKVK